jgi:alpha-tubulin suppressor-like RCC1 family protein
MALSLLLTLGACGGGGGDAADDPAAVASLRIVDSATLFTTSGQRRMLSVQALGAAGQVLKVPISWQSSQPGVVSVAANGEATAGTTQGSALLTASVGSHRSTVVAVMASAAAGTALLADTQIDGEPQASVANAPLRVGSTYTVTLQAGVAAPAVGQLVLGQGAKAVAGEVKAVNGRVLTLALVPLQRLLPDLQLDLDLPLVAGAPRLRTSSLTPAKILSAGGVRPLAEASFSVAGFGCDAEGSAGGVELAKKEVQPLGLDSLRYRVLWNSQRKLLRLSGQPGVQFELEPSAKIAFTGKVDCKLELADIPIPLPPSIGLFLGVGFPVGVGFTLEGALPVNGIALNLKGQAQASVVVGFDCNPGCSSLNSVTPTGTVTPTLVAPEFTANRLDLSGQVYAWANFEGGARWSSTLQFDAIEAQAGLKFATTVASENAQAKDAASAGQYALSFEASAGPTEALGDFASLVGLLLDQAKFETSVPLGRSPTATLTLDKTSFKALDDVKFQVDLNAAEVLFPLQGYNVQAVRVYRKTTASNGSSVLVLANEQTASSGQTQFTIPWLATVDSGSDISFVAFVQTKLLSGLRWQVGVAQISESVVPRVERISAGQNHVCAMTPAGGVKCWGLGHGRLGNGSVEASRVPVDVTGLGSGMVAISVGEVHTCGVTETGAAKCWGTSSRGALGDGTNLQRLVPVDVAGMNRDVLAVSAGGEHTCGITKAGAAKCWGRNSFGTLGNGTTIDSAVPADVTGLGSDVVAISAFGEHTCAIANGGVVKCWGFNRYGLGDGTSIESNVPVDVTGLDNDVKAISVGVGHACAIIKTGTVRCWGVNGAGQLGNGTTIDSAVPVDVTGLGRGVVAISAGAGLSCAMTGTGTVKCWGFKPGDGSSISSAVPVDVLGLGGGVSAFSAGVGLACALTSTGLVKCWGANAFLDANSDVPVTVIGFP